MPLDPPPRDDHGEVVPHDHLGIGPDDGIIRRVAPQHIVPDPKAPGGKRLSSMAFRPSSGLNGGLLVDLQKLIEEAGLDAKKFIIKPPFIGAVRFTADILRSEGYQLGFDPIPDENPYHGEVWGNFSNSKRTRLLGLAEEFVQPQRS